MKTMTAKELKKRLEQGEVLLIDVRELAEHQLECIDGAFLNPLAEFSYEKLPSTSHPIVIHCRSGKRSEEACRRLLEKEPALSVYSLEGGILAWKNAGYPVKNV